MSFIGAAIGAVAAIGGAAISADASRKAANTQADAAQKGIDTQWQMYQQQQERLAPWLQGGRIGQSELMRLLGIGGSAENPTFDPNAQLVKPFSPSDLTTDPSYKWRLNQGMDAILNKSSAVGGFGGGNTLRALTDYAQGLASTEYGNAFARYNQNQSNLYSRIAGLSNTGANAAGGINALGANVADNTSSLQAAQGAYGAAGALGQGNASQQLLNNFLLGSQQSRGGGVTNPFAGGGGYGNALAGMQGQANSDPMYGSPWLNGYDL